MARRGKAETEVQTVITGKDKSKRAFTSLQNSLKNTSRTLQVVQGPLGPIAGRFTALSSVMGTVSLRAVAFSAAFVGVGLALKAGISSYSKTEAQLGQLDAQLKATGFSAGKSALELEELAQGVARATLASVEEVRKAEGILLSFRSITEDAFDGALVAAQDLAAAGFGSITDAAKQLGKALEDPKTGLSSLRRAGVTFSESQKELIKTLVDSGDKARAMGMILRGIESQVGGAGAGAAGGIAGKFDSLTQSVGNFWDAIGERAERAGFLDFLDGAAEGIQNMADSIDSLDSASFAELGRRLQENFAKIQETRQELARRQSVLADPNAIVRQPVQPVVTQLKELGEERALLLAQFRTRQDAANLADVERGKAQGDLAAEEAASAEKKRQLELEKELAKWQKNAESGLQRSLSLEIKRNNALNSLLDTLDPIAAIEEKYIADQRTLNENIGNQVELQRLLLVLADQRREAIENITKAEVELTDMQKKVNQGAVRLGRIMGDGFKSALLEGKKFGDVMEGILKKIAAQLVETLIIQRAVGAFAGAVGGSGAFTTFFSGMSRTTATGKSGGGSIAKTGEYMIGESGPEKLTLPKGSVITPNKDIGGGGARVSIQVVNNAAADTQVSTESERQPDGSQLVRFILDTVNNDVSSGGQTARVMQQAFGGRQKAIVR